MNMNREFLHKKGSVNVCRLFAYAVQWLIILAFIMVAGCVGRETEGLPSLSATASTDEPGGLAIRGATTEPIPTTTTEVSSEPTRGATVALSEPAFDPPLDSAWPRKPLHTDYMDMLGGFPPEEVADMAVTIIREQNWFHGNSPDNIYWRLNNTGEVRVRFAYGEWRKNYSSLYIFFDTGEKDGNIWFILKKQESSRWYQRYFYWLHSEYGTFEEILFEWPRIDDGEEPTFIAETTAYIGESAYPLYDFISQDQIKKEARDTIDFMAKPSFYPPGKYTMFFSDIKYPNTEKEDFKWSYVAVDREGRYYFPYESPASDPHDIFYAERLIEASVYQTEFEVKE